MALGNKRATYRRDTSSDSSTPDPRRRPLRPPQPTASSRGTHRRPRHRQILGLLTPSAARSHPAALPAIRTGPRACRPDTSTPPAAILDAEARTPRRLRHEPAHPPPPLATVARLTAAKACPAATIGCRSTRPSPSRRSLPRHECSTSWSGPPGLGSPRSWGPCCAVWETDHGPGSVIGFAPSAAAAEVLAAELGAAPAENTAKWLTEHRLLADRLAARTRMAANGVPSEALRALDAQIARWQLHARAVGDRRRGQPRRDVHPRRDCHRGTDAGAQNSPCRRLGAALSSRRRRRLRSIG